MKTKTTITEQIILGFDKQLVKLLKRDLNIIKTTHISKHPEGTLAA
jgi:hypothetical protein